MKSIFFWNEECNHPKYVHSASQMHTEIKWFMVHHEHVLSRTCFEVVFQGPMQTAEKPHKTPSSVDTLECRLCWHHRVPETTTFPRCQDRSGAPRTRLKHAGPPQGRTEELVLLQRDDLRNHGNCCPWNRPPGLRSLSQEEAQDLILWHRGVGEGDKWRIYGLIEMSQNRAAQDSSHWSQRQLSTGREDMQPRNLYLYLILMQIVIWVVATILDGQV